MSYLQIDPFSAWLNDTSPIDYSFMGYDDQALLSFSTKQVGPMVRTSQCLESLQTTEPAVKVLTMSIKQIQEQMSLVFNIKSPFNI